MKDAEPTELIEREFLTKNIDKTIASLEEGNPEIETILEKIRFKEEAEEWGEITNDATLPHQIITASDLLDRSYPEQPWLIDKVLPLDGITLIVGEAGTLKSYLSLYISKVLITQEKFLDHFEVNKKCRILIIDKENKLRRVQRRMVGLTFPKTDDLYFLEYPERFSFEDREFVSVVVEFVKKAKIDVVILDSFIDMFEGNENSSTDTARAFNYIRNLSHTASFIVLHHDSKPMPNMQRTAGQKTRGSSNIIAQVDTQFYLEKGKDMKSIIIEQGKGRDEAPVPKFIIDIISDTEGEIINFSYQGEFKESIKLIEEISDWIYGYLREKPMLTKKDLETAGQEFNYKPRTIRDALVILKKKEFIDEMKKEGYGNTLFYFISATEEEELEEQMEKMDPRI